MPSPNTKTPRGAIVSTAGKTKKQIVEELAKHLRKAGLLKEDEQAGQNQKAEQTPQNQKT